MSESSVSYVHTFEDVNGTIKQTNSLLRSLNAIRVTARDFQELLRKPTFAGLFWTLVNLSRTYNSLKRINRLLTDEVNAGATLGGLMAKIAYVEPAQTSEAELTFNMPVEFTATAYRDNYPIDLDKIDLSELLGLTRDRVQEIMEENGDRAVEDAREILRSRLLHPEKSTGFLETSIGWTPETSGIRLTANAPYSFWVEEGQRSFTGHHFLRDATEVTRMRLSTEIRSELAKLIEEKLS